MCGYTPWREQRVYIPRTQTTLWFLLNKRPHLLSRKRGILRLLLSLACPPYPCCSHFTTTVPTLFIDFSLGFNYTISGMIFILCPVSDVEPRDFALGGREVGHTSILPLQR